MTRPAGWIGPFDHYVRDSVIRLRRERKVPGLTARQYRAHRRTLRRLWDGLPKELKR